MTTKQSDTEIKIQMYINRKERYFTRVQKLYDLSRVVETDDSKMDEFIVRANELEQNRELFEQTIEQISMLQMSINPEFSPNTKESESFDELYFAIKNVLVKFSTKNVSNYASLRSSQNSSNGNVPQPRLPKIQLIQFDGNLENWVTFRDTFCSLVHNNNTIGNIEKFHYLLSVLSGPALQVVKTLPISSDNYDVVWSSLIERYENKRALATRYLDKIFNFKPLCSESINGLNSFIETFQDSIKALEMLKLDNLTGFLLFYIGFRNLDSTTKRYFEQKLNKNDIPTFDILLEFLSSQIRVLEMSSDSKALNKTNFKNNNNILQNSRTKKTYLAATVSEIGSNMKDKICIFCNKPGHSIYRCFVYINLSPEERLNKIERLKLCKNCLRKDHSFNDCPSKVTCIVCKSKHHHTLHSDKHVSIKSKPCVQNDIVPNCSSSLTCSTKSTVLLGTAVVHVADRYGCYQSVRLLIDSGAQNGFITKQCAQRLGLKPRKCNRELRGLGGSLINNHGLVSCTLKPVHKLTPVFKMDAVIVTRITGHMPTVTLPTTLVRNYNHLNLADPNFYVPNEIDMLLAGDVFPEIYNGAVFRPSDADAPPALDSIFGYVITGSVYLNNCLDDSNYNFNSFNNSNERSNNSSFNCLLASNNLDQLMQSFWETENLTCDLPSNPDDIAAEKLFVSQYQRNASGRYILKYPFKIDNEQLGDSKQIALKRFFNLERKLSHDVNLRNEYSIFLHEYLSLGHMTHVGDFSNTNSNYIIPHHCIHKMDSSTTKLRVVFDASCKTSNGMALNNILYTGPKLQADLVKLLTRLRLHKICMTSDISKMYRQILIDQSQRNYQHILWRNSIDEPIQVYELNTVTYGIVSSPFLAIRTLRQLAEDEGDSFPLAKRALLNGFYMDDLLWSVDTKDEARQLQIQLVQLLRRGDFELRKWSSSCRDVLSSFPDDNFETPIQFDGENNVSIKILGLHWLPSVDMFSFKTMPMESCITKRTVLSQIAKLFDPLGFAAPAILYAKCFMQKLWCQKLGWDDNLPESLAQEWQTFSSEISMLSKLRHHRYALINNYNQCQLIGFSDASSLGLAAVVYIRTVNTAGEVQVSLLFSKSKVAPLKTVSIPRLELMAAHLLSKMLKYIYDFLVEEIRIDNIYAFTDSSSTLCWLNTPAYKLKTFVANRVTKIHECTSENIQWFHVDGKYNSADICSRGTTPAGLIAAADEWLRGPRWLYEEWSSWPIRDISHFSSSSDISEIKSNCELNVLIQNSSNHLENDFELVINRYSKFNQLQRVVAYCLRFIKNCKIKSDNKQLRKIGFLSTDELIDSHNSLIQIIQNNYFRNDIKLIKKGDICSPALRKLHPFIDSRGLLMVGGRLSEATYLSLSKRHCNVLKIYMALIFSISRK